MSWNSKLIAELYLLLVLVETSLSQGCDPSGINCISCTEYRTCIAGSPQGKLVSCKNGGSCADDNLKQCQIKLNCYALNECVQNGIFPDATNDSKYFVCLSDGSAGFLKYEFSCPDGQFFDQSMSCVPRETSTSPASSTTSTPIPTTTTSPSSPTPIPPFVCPGPGIFPNLDNCKMYYRCSTSLKLFYYICPGRSYFNENILKCSLIISPACQEQILKNSTSTSPLVTTTTATTFEPTTTISATTANISTTTTTAITTTTSTTSTTPTTTTTSTTPTTTTTSTTPTTTTTSTTPTTTTTSTTPTTTTTSTTPTTTTTTSTTPTSTTSQSPAPFSCPTAGTFENPADCKTYYRCSTSGKVFRYICPGMSYFNEITKRCNLVVTARCRKLIQG